MEGQKCQMLLKEVLFQHSQHYAILTNISYLIHFGELEKNPKPQASIQSKNIVNVEIVG